MLIETSRLILRNFKTDDLLSYIRVISEEEVKKYIPNFYFEDIYRKIAFNKDLTNDFYFAITDKTSNIFIGAIIGYAFTSCDIDVIYFISKKYQNKGYCPEAILGFSEYIKLNSAYENLAFSINISNNSSLKVIEKIGAKKVSTGEYQLKL